MQDDTEEKEPTTPRTGKELWGGIRKVMREVSAVKFLCRSLQYTLRRHILAMVEIGAEQNCSKAADYDWEVFYYSRRSLSTEALFIAFITSSAATLCKSLL